MAAGFAHRIPERRVNESDAIFVFEVNILTLADEGFKSAFDILEEMGRAGIQKKRKRHISFNSESSLSNGVKHSNLKKVSQDQVLSPNLSDNSKIMVKEISDQKPGPKILSPNHNEDEEPSLVKEKSTSLEGSGEKILSPNTDNKSADMVKENREEVASLENLSPDDVKHRLVQGSIRLKWEGEVYDFTPRMGVSISAGGSVFIRTTRCGKKCGGCPHGPYLIEKRKIGNKWKQKSIGTANRLGAM